MSWCLVKYRDSFTLPNIIRVIRSRRQTWAGHVESMEEMRNAYKILVGKYVERDHFEYLDVDEGIILECNLGK
jgi:hypothetical protein